MTYFNTNRETGGELQRSRKKVGDQNGKVLHFFWSRRPRAFSPTDVWRAVFEQRVPITSVRRAITTLTNDGRLTKTEQQKRGPFGKREHLWVYRNNQRES